MLPISNLHPSNVQQSGVSLPGIPIMTAQTCIRLSQVYNGNNDDQSYFDYEDLDAGDSMSSLLHEVGEVEYKGLWSRVW